MDEKKRAELDRLLNDAKEELLQDQPTDEIENVSKERFSIKGIFKKERTKKREKVMLCIFLIALLLSIYGIIWQVFLREQNTPTEPLSDETDSLQVGTEDISTESETDVADWKLEIPENDTVESMLGDINGDGKVSLVDAQMLLNACNHLIELDEEQEKAARVLGRDYYNLEDVLELMRMTMRVSE